MTQLVKIYVRKPKIDYGREGRRITFHIPEDVEVSRYLDMGYAVDGTSFLKDILSKDREPFPITLLEEERSLVSALLADGHDVEFY